MNRKWMALFLCLFLLVSLVAAGSTHQTGEAPQTVTVEITEQGFQPESLKLKANVAARITFVRRTDATCAKEVMIKDYDIKKKLLLNEPVVVELTPKKSDFTYTCGMNMLRGKVIVQ